MKTALIILAATAASAMTTESFRFEPGPQNRVALEVEKTGLLRGKKHVFVFGRYTGALDYNPSKQESSKVHFELQSNSIMCIDTWISDKDKVKVMKAALDDALQADKYPTITFVSNQVQSTGPNKFDVTGTLSLRGVIQPVTVAVTKNGNIYDGNAAVNMKDYGIKPPSTALGAIGTKEVMNLTFHLAAAAS
jgi:polyisoprenoid-binding protein YceI